MTRRFSFPMPHLGDLLRRAAGHKYYSGVDAVSGFNHLPLTEAARERLSICTPTGSYAWVVLQFGPLNGPQAFQATMARIFGNLSQEHIAIYIDDVAVFSG